MLARLPVDRRLRDLGRRDGCRTVVGWAVALTLAASGCEQVQEALEQATSTPTPREPPPSAESIEADELNGDVDCYNRAVSRARESAERYFEHVPREAGPDCSKHKGTLYRLYEDSVEVCNKAAAAGQGGISYPALEKAVTEFAAVNAALVPLVAQVDDYWGQEDFKDDACTRGKALHGQLVAAFDAFESAAQGFSRELDLVKSDADRRALERVEQRRGKNYEWHVRYFMQVAKAHIKVIPESDAEPIDKDAYAVTFGALEAAHDALESYAAGHKAELEATLFMGAGFDEEAKAYTVAAKLAKRELEVEPQDAGELDAKVNDLLRAYNELTAASNRMTFRYDE